MRKRTILSLVAILVIASLVKASPVDPQRAIKVAQEFVPKSTDQRAPIRGSQTEPSSSIVYTHMMPNSDRPAFYIVNVDDGAFVLVSADDIAHQVLGYSLSSTWPVSKDGSVELPAHIKGFFDDLAAQMEAAVESEPTRAAGSYKASPRSSAPNRSPSLPDSVGPLLTTTWNQGQYYNVLCPEDANGPDGHVYTGCVATAMAQIVKYWSDPTPGRGTHSYSTNYGTLTVNYAEASYDYANMPDVLDENSSQTQINAVAQLIYHCGVATNMKYGSSESEAFNQEVRAALINYFHFSPNLSYAEKAFFTNEEWNDLLRKNIAANHPVFYSGHGNGGHAFICDGYNSEGYYHFNFGWGGFADGWFLCNSINPSSMNYNGSQAAIVDIVPDNTGNVIIGQMDGTSTFYVDEPLELYNLMGNNAYVGNNYTNSCNNIITFISTDEASQMVVDIMEYEDQTIQFYNGNNTNNIIDCNINEMTPVVASQNAITISYSGNMFFAGFKLLINHIGVENNNRLVSNISTFVESTTVHITWTENGNASRWQVEYGEKGFQIGEGTVYNTNSNSISFNNLQKLTTYDFYICPIADNDQIGPRNKVAVLVEAPYWTDIVTSQPEGFVLNQERYTAEISTAEGLVWWAKNGCNMDAYLTDDIDLSGYKWKPVELWFHNLYGQGHEIRNAYINEKNGHVGLFSIVYQMMGDGGIIDGVGLRNFTVNGKDLATGGLCGRLGGVARNCYITNSTIEGSSCTGGLIGENYGTVINSFANVHVDGKSTVGLLVGTAQNGIERNCYATGSLKLRSYSVAGSIVGTSITGEISNCYALDSPAKIVGYNENTIISDTSSFVRNNSDFILISTVFFDDNPCSNLLTALNNELVQYNNSLLCTWISDNNTTNDGYPVLAEKYLVSCPNATNLSIQTVKIGNDNTVVIDWTENGGATLWDIRYRRHDLMNSSYTYISTDHHPYTISELPLGYVYDFCVRAKIDAEHKSGWSDVNTLLVDLPHWTDIVTEQPIGYAEDNNGNVVISSVEGLVWLAAKVNGLHNQEPNTFAGKTITLNSDLNLEGYRWTPIGDNLDGGFKGTFDGLGHSISNIYVNEESGHLGLFKHVGEGKIMNINMVGGTVRSPLIPSYSVGGLFGSGEWVDVLNCHSSVSVYGNSRVGSLFGSLESRSGTLIGEKLFKTKVESIVSNCSATGAVFGRAICGGLIGFLSDNVKIQNCFSTGNITITDRGEAANQIGGLVGSMISAKVVNCYTTGAFITGDNNCSFLGKIVGGAKWSHLQFIYGQNDINIGLALTGVDDGSEIRDDKQYYHNGNENTLLSTVSISDNNYNDLFDALNAWIVTQNDQNLKTWELNNTGYPILGDYFEPTCYNPTNLIVSNATKVGDLSISTELEWEQIGAPNHWEVLYVESEHDLSEGVIRTVYNNPCVLTDLPTGHPLDFYVRAINSNDDISNWSNSITYIPEKIHWTEAVTSKPDGYNEDLNGNILISSAEGLSWLSSVVNGLNGNVYDEDRLYGKKIVLMADVDLSDYRWTPICDQEHLVYGFVFDGNGHTIKGLYCNELSDLQGLFGKLYDADLFNVNIEQCIIKGQDCVGAIAGNSSFSRIVNCMVKGNLYGIERVGGISGTQQGNKKGSIINSLFIGTVTSRSDITKVGSNSEYIGGICGGVEGDSIVNCYMVSEIPDCYSYSGIVTGTTFPITVLNCYYKSYSTTLGVTHNNSITSNISSFSGDGIIWTLNTPPYVNGGFQYNLDDALNAWVDANSTKGVYRHWEPDTANVNGGYPIFAPLPKSIVTFKNANGETLQIDTLNYGSQPEYRGATPSLESTTQYAYIFREWSEALTPVTHDVTFTALYDSHMFGDVTDNSSVDVQDATIVVNYILGERPDGYLYHMADMNNDTEIDVFDLTAIINVILGRTSFHAPMRTGISGYESTAYLFGDRSSMHIVGEEDIYLRAVSDKIGLSIANASRFTSFQMDIEVPDGAELQNVELTGSESIHMIQKAKIGDNLYRVIALSMSSQPLADINDELVSFHISNAANAEISVSNVMFVTPKGEAHYFNGASIKTPTIINEITTDKDEVIFDLSGRRIYKKPNDLESGVYIINKKKVIIK